MTPEPTPKVTPSSVVLMRILFSSFALLHSFPFFNPLPFLSFLCLLHFLTFLFNCSLLLLLVNCTPLHGLILFTQQLVNIKSSKISLSTSSSTVLPPT